jgi:hypothetical protein
VNGTSAGEWFGVAPTGRSFHVPFANVVTFANDRMVGESLYIDLASMCEQAGLPVETIRAAAKALAASASQ